MYHAQKKLQQIRMASFAAASLFTILTSFISVRFFLYPALYAIAICIAAEGVVLQWAFRRQSALLLFLLSFLLFFLTTSLVIHAWKGT